MITVSSAEAQNQFGKLLDTVQREPVVITRHGRPTAYVISPEDMRELQGIRQRRVQAAEDFKAFFARSDTRLTDDARHLTDDAVAELVKSAR